MTNFTWKTLRSNYSYITVKVSSSFGNNPRMQKLQNRNNESNHVGKLFSYYAQEVSCGSHVGILSKISSFN